MNTMNEMDDNEIVRLFHSEKGEEQAFRILVEKYSQRLYWHIRKIVISHEDSDDVLQETFVKVWQGLKEFRQESRLFTWMYRVATNEAINFLAEKSRRPYGNSQEITPMLENQLESDIFFNGDDIQRELQRAVLKLPEKQRIVFNMKYFEDMKYEDMAEVRNVAVGTLKATYHNAVKKIEESMRIVDTLPSFE